MSGTASRTGAGRRVAVAAVVAAVGALLVAGLALFVDTTAERPEFGFVRAVDLDAGSLEIDPAEWLTGRAGARAAVEDGQAAPGTSEMPNGFYIRNRTRDTVTVPLSADATVTMSQLYDPAGQREVTIDLSTFAALWTDRVTDAQRYFRDAPYRFTYTDGSVSGIVEQYVP